MSTGSTKRRGAGALEAWTRYCSLITLLQSDAIKTLLDFWVDRSFILH